MFINLVVILTFLRNLGIGAIPFDSQPFAPILAFLFILFAARKNSFFTSNALFCRYLFISLGCVIFLLSASNFFCFVSLPDVVKQIVLYSFGVLIAIFASSSYVSKNVLLKSFKYIYLLIAVGIVLNFFTGDIITSMFVNRGVIDLGSARGFASFFSEQSALSTTCIYLLFISYIFSFPKYYYIFPVVFVFFAGAAQGFFDLLVVSICFLLALLIVLLRSLKISRFLAIASSLTCFVFVFLASNINFLPTRMQQLINAFGSLDFNLIAVFGGKAMSIKLGYFPSSIILLTDHPFNLCPLKHTYMPLAFSSSYDKYIQFWDSLGFQSFLSRFPYNTFANLVIDFSLLGLLLFIVFYFIFFIKSPVMKVFHKSRSFDRGFSFAFIILLASSLIIGKSSLSFYPLWFLLGIFNNKYLALSIFEKRCRVN